MPQTNSKFIPLSQLGAHVADTAECLRRARALYEREPTDLHLENLREAEAEHQLATRHKK